MLCHTCGWNPVHTLPSLSKAQHSRHLWSTCTFPSQTNKKNSYEIARDKIGSTSVRRGGSSRADRNSIGDNRELNENDTADVTSSIVDMNEDDLMIINKSGVAIRLKVDSLRTMGRATQGVKLINLKGSDTIAAVAKVEGGSGDEEENGGEEIIENSSED